MLHPSYAELMNVVNQNSIEEDPIVKSRYSIVLGTAKRARQLVDEGYMDRPDHQKKPLSVAVDELFEGKIRILDEAEAAAMREEQEKAEAEEKARKEAEAAAKAAEEAVKAEAADSAEDNTEENSEENTEEAEEAEPVSEEE